MFVFMSVNVFLSLNRQEPLAVASSTPYHHHHHYLSLNLSFLLFCHPLSFLLLGLLFAQVSAATNVPNRLEISEWRERQDETGPPLPLLSPSSSVQWTDRHCRWFPPLLPPPPPPPAPGAPAPALLWDSSDSADKQQRGGKG